jgi:hypothetical protein
LAYQRWDSEPLLEVLDMSDGSRLAAADQLRTAAAGIGELTAIEGPAQLERAALTHLPAGNWEVTSDRLTM